MVKITTRLTQALVAAYDRVYAKNEDRTISVNPLVAELASWYERFRTAMDYNADEVILRSAIERILKRRLILGGNGQNVAAPLIRELVWARYFPDSSIPESVIVQVAQTIDLHLSLEKKINDKHRINKGLVNEWILQLLSAEIEKILKPNDPKDLMSNFIFQIFRKRISIVDDTDQIRDIQTFIAVRRAYASDDLAFLRYHLFTQYFDKLTRENFEEIVDGFPQAVKKIKEQFEYMAKDKIYTYVKNQIAPFLILDGVFRKNRGHVSRLVDDEERLNMEILSACLEKYKAIRGKVGRAIIRSVIFIFFTKAVFALFIEGTYERLIYGQVIWSSIAINVLTPALLMIIVGLLIKTPSRENSFKIQKRIHTILFDEDPALETPLVVKKKPGRTDPWLWTVFLALWLATFGLSFGAIVFVLSKLSVNPFSQAVFIFFLAIVSFVSYRINRTAHMYTIRDRKDDLASILFDFFFMPFIQVGSRLTLAISQINIILFVFDFIIETPFKGIFAFFEQWLFFLRAQREKLD
ncbi:hypothetical protein A3C26_02330 [Candidatus Daviesbacteria bacterium RIFCSPHIGHO2_02_FULL_39_12]|uniref:Uncharacterized protein n=2 Tax=Candidatus Daviesiibacteriota TaxID=1752718 RepID=A0A1F5JA65_9BACT|nr:MAG: hypothetical protein A3C26_02330 [Candidatus Daviesbacteria bacterium RIFCSPHIGHO2_02_FULL_39_12]OGE71694.1 MAG: hypothetical protein A3H40_01640 [Candidatus Daviesbacteria bacterium RIFCSPLOWO2_02_FULL_38_15]